MLIGEDDVIKIRVAEEKDAAELFALVDQNREHLKSFLAWVDKTVSVNDTALYIKRANEAFAAGTLGYFLIYFEDRIAGVISLKDIDKQNLSAAIGYWLDASLCRRGLVSRAVKIVMLYAFQELKLHRLELRCSPNNRGSLRIAERLGFERVGVLRECEWLYDHFEDNIIFSISERLRPE